MSADDSLDLVIDFATKRRDEEVRAMIDARRVVDAARNKLGLLTRYRDDFNAAPNRTLEVVPTDPVRMANTRAFIDKLDTAIGQQQREVDVADAKASEATQAVQGAEMRLKALERLRERRSAEEARVENRREQNRTDAFAARAARDGGASLEGRTN